MYILHITYKVINASQESIAELMELINCFSHHPSINTKTNNSDDDDGMNDNNGSKVNDYDDSDVPMSIQLGDYNSSSSSSNSMLLAQPSINEVMQTPATDSSNSGNRVSKRRVNDTNDSNMNTDNTVVTLPVTRKRSKVMQFRGPI
jgi:hypothetical protein